MSTLSTSSLPNTDNGSLVLTLDTAKSYAGPTNAISFRPRSSAQGGAVMSVPQRFRLDIVGMADNEGHAFDSYLTSLLNVLVQPEGEELIALCASGATYQFDVGASSESRSGGGKYHNVGGETRRVSKAVSSSAYYETFDAVTSRIRALVASARARSSSSGPFIGPSTNQDYRCKLEDALVRLFQNADEQSALL